MQLTTDPGLVTGLRHEVYPDESSLRIHNGFALQSDHSCYMAY